MNHHPFTFFGLIPGVSHDNLHMVTATFVVGMLVLAALVVYPRLKVASAAVLPDARFSVRSVFEMFFSMLRGLAQDVIGPDADQYLPFVGSIFFFVFFSNLIGAVPGFLPATENWATGAALAIITLIAYNYFGFQAQGPKYALHFFAPISVAGIKNIFGKILVLIPLLIFQVLFGTIEVISNVLRPVSLSIRLFVNITADHKVLGIFSDLAPYLIPIPFVVLGIFVAFMQAFIFTILSMVYISMAVAHGDH